MDLDLSQYLTIKAVAHRFRKSEKTVYGWIYQGRIEAVKVVGTVYIHQDELDHLVGVPGDDGQPFREIAF